MSKLNVPRPPSTAHLTSHEGISYFPLTSLTSPCGRLTLDPFILADVQPLFDLSHVPFSFSGNANSHPYFGGLPYGPFASPAEYAAFCQANIWAHPENCLFTIRTNSAPDGVTNLSGEPVVIGMIGYISTVPGHLRTEMGHVWYDYRYRGTFVGKAAPAALLQWAFEDLGFRRVEWKCDERNKASRGAAESIGFQFEGTFRKHMVVRDGFARTTWYLAMTDDDWRDSVKLKLWNKLSIVPAGVDSPSRQQLPTDHAATGRPHDLPRKPAESPAQQPSTSGSTHQPNRSAATVRASARGGIRSQLQGVISANLAATRKSPSRASIYLVRGPRRAAGISAAGGPTIPSNIEDATRLLTQSPSTDAPSRVAKATTGSRFHKLTREAQVAELRRCQRNFAEALANLSRPRDLADCSV